MCILYSDWDFSYPDWGFSVIFLSCKANVRVKLAKTRHGPHSSKLVVIVFFCCYLCCSMYCLCVNVYCTTATGWQPNCSKQIYHITIHRSKSNFKQYPCAYALFNERVQRMWSKASCLLNLHIRRYPPSISGDFIKKLLSVPRANLEAVAKRKFWSLPRIKSCSCTEHDQPSQWPGPVMWI